VLTVIDEETISADLPEVFACFWDATLWPAITPHVKRIEMLESGDRFQRFRMTVEANGQSHTVESERSADPFRRISYRQTTPPAFLREHTGEWSFHRRGNQVAVRLTHRAVMDEEKAIAALQVRDAKEASRRIAETLRANGARTIAAVKQHLEARAPAARTSEPPHP
jgi:hypothetical protein